MDVNEILALAGVAAHSVVRPAAPLTTFIAGFAAGLASGSGQATDAASMQAAMDVARSLSPGLRLLTSRRGTAVPTAADECSRRSAPGEDTGE